MTETLVSVLIPCYNAAPFIGETLKSVFRQTWPQLEVIVVDDGSQDDSVGEVLRFPRARLIRQAHAGAAAARNRAFAESSGTFIQLLDADDLIAPDKVARQVERLEDNPRCIASAEWGRFYRTSAETRFEPESVWRDLDPVEWLVLSRADGLGMLFPALWLVPRGIADAAGPWDETLSLGNDGEYFTRILLSAERVLFCEGARCYYRSGLPGSLSGKKSAKALASGFRVLELCEAHLRAREDSERVRQGFALSWQHFAHAAYPYDADLAESALAHARDLHGVAIRPGGGPAFHAVSRLLGWRFARRLQVASGRP